MRSPGAGIFAVRDRAGAPGRPRQAGLRRSSRPRRGDRSGRVAPPPGRPRRGVARRRAIQPGPGRAALGHAERFARSGAGLRVGRPPGGPGHEQRLEPDAQAGHRACVGGGRVRSAGNATRARMDGRGPAWRGPRHRRRAPIPGPRPQARLSRAQTDQCGRSLGLPARPAPSAPAIAWNAAWSRLVALAAQDCAAPGANVDGVPVGRLVRAQRDECPRPIPERRRSDLAVAGRAGAHAGGAERPFLERQTGAAGALVGDRQPASATRAGSSRSSTNQPSGSTAQYTCHGTPCATAAKKSRLAGVPLQAAAGPLPPVVPDAVGGADVGSGLSVCTGLGLPVGGRVGVPPPVAEGVPLPGVGADG